MTADEAERYAVQSKIGTWVYFDRFEDAELFVKTGIAPVRKASFECDIEAGY